MNLRDMSTARIVGLWQTAALAVRRVLRGLIEGHAGQGDDADLLHPRCCRTEHF
jgi:hypothetical protein